MANYRQAEGFPPHTVATRFSLWSNVRRRMLVNFPYHLLVLYSLPIIAMLFRGRSLLLPLALTLVTAGVAEFAVCTLADAIDTHRHLFLFHVITETLILMTIGGVSFRRVDHRLAWSAPAAKQPLVLSSTSRRGASA